MVVSFKQTPNFEDAILEKKNLLCSQPGVVQIHWQFLVLAINENFSACQVAENQFVLKVVKLSSIWGQGKSVLDNLSKY